MKPSEILRQAARVTEQTGRCGCGSIIQVASGDVGPALKYFLRVAPRGKGCGEFWWKWPEENDARIVGLCLAATIAKSENK